MPDAQTGNKENKAAATIFGTVVDRLAMSMLTPEDPDRIAYAVGKDADGQILFSVAVALGKPHAVALADEVMALKKKIKNGMPLDFLNKGPFTVTHNTKGTSSHGTKDAHPTKHRVNRPRKNRHRSKPSP